MRIGVEHGAFSLVAAGVGVVAALMWGAPAATADPGAPAPPPPPAPFLAAAGEAPPPPPPAPEPEPWDPLAFLRPAPPPEAPPAEPPAAEPLPTMPEGMPHLPSPDSPPPGSTTDPAAKSTENPNIEYLKDLWHAVQNQEISGKEALILGLAQRNLAAPYPQQAPGPNVPVSGTSPAPEAPPPAPEAPPPPADAPAPPPAPLFPWLAPPPPPPAP